MRHSIVRNHVASKIIEPVQNVFPTLNVDVLKFDQSRFQSYLQTWIRTVTHPTSSSLVITSSYDDKFNDYVKYIKEIIPDRLTDIMRTGTPYGPGNAYFQCTYSQNGRNHTRGSCPGDIGIDTGTFTVYYDLVDAEGFYGNLSANYALTDTITTAKIEIALGSWMGTDDDIVQSLSLAVFLLSQAVASMQSVVAVAESYEAAQKKKMINVILMGVLLVVPFMGEFDAVADVFAGLSRIITLIGDAGAGATTVYAIVEDPKMAPLTILETLLLGGMRDPQEFSTMGAARRGMRDDDFKMLASLLRPKKRRVYAERSPFSSPYTTRDSQWPALQNNAPQRGPEPGYEEINGYNGTHTLPVYDITHAIRPLIVARCETTLTWDQLRSPQISQFLVKPIQQKIRALHFSRATLYALITNCLQFSKEVHLNPGNSGVSQTRAMVSELLAIKLLREYSTRELIDALSYEFYPLNGQTPTATVSSDRAPGWYPTPGSKRPAIARVSCLEVAIRAQAKRFLSHPLVVQQLEAIWAGTIVFHSASDYLHRSPAQVRNNGRLQYGTAPDPSPLDTSHRQPQPNVSGLRRSVTIYDPRDASLFKLSRLRVPRYRQFLSTLSFAVLLGLFLAVLNQRRLEITPLEVIFWLWSAGFMLDEIVGFNEQGFSLYLMSFWNLFDLGILFLLFCYYCMRLYGAILPYTRNHIVADQAYDILAANAVLLFPRLFSVLDHYRYFSQLLIAFRIMASDLIAVFLLIIIACSGFFVAFTQAFGNSDDHSPGAVAYALFQMLMGFTPTAWSLWDEYNMLGKLILTVFLFICHFVVVTILITVLTNSFMSIVQNANQEHQFLFAVNTISMVKSDALFSYVAPTNILAWLITPLRYFVPFREFVRINRTIIKITHLPILFTICFYEKAILSSQVIDSTDLIESTSRGDSSDRFRARRRFRAFSSQIRPFVREPSVATYQKDRALDEVFRRPFRDATARRPVAALDRRGSHSVVNKWMQTMGSGSVNPPDEQDSEEVERLERFPRGRTGFRRTFTRSLRDFTETNHSATSDADRPPHVASSPATPRNGRTFMTPMRSRQLSRQTGMEGDDELTSDDNGGWAGEQRSGPLDSEDDTPQTTKQSPIHTPPKHFSSRPSTARLKSRKTSPARRIKNHTRNYSGATMLYNPISSENNHEAAKASPSPVRPRAETPDPAGGAVLSTSADQWTLKRHNANGSRLRNVTMTRSDPMSVPDVGGFSVPDSHFQRRRQASILDGLGSDLGDNKAIANGFLGGVPSSLTTQIAYATGNIRRADSPSSSQDMLSKLVLARMNNIEEGFREVIKEVKDLRRGGTSRSESRVDEQRGVQREKKKRRPDKKEPKKDLQGSRKSKTSSEGQWSDELAFEKRRDEPSGDDNL
ncbi:alpha/beta hydrolase fold family protein [Aspergillus niger]|uniref:Alpha/beta hydrolase fold family protein n=1 Tax=Aspergillus niger TaxID=5061 RepID=A0A505HXN4_ASPNG|nr:alpha/beta hydrolase fold family protein [Aspergillus niger]